MEGAVGPAGSDLAHLALCGIEEHGWGADAAPKGVEAAATEVLARAGGVFLFTEGDF